MIDKVSPASIPLVRLDGYQIGNVASKTLTLNFFWCTE